MVNGTRVVVTGSGTITALGETTRETWEAVKAGKSGIRRVQAFDPSATPSQVASEVLDFKPEARLERKEARRMSRFVQFAMAATKEALTESGLEISEANRDQVGVLVGSAIGGLEQIEEAHTILKERGPARISPFTVPMMIADMGAGQISITIGARGPNFCTVSACSSGAHAIGEAFEIIRRGDATAMIAGGSEACVTPLALAAFCAARAVSTRATEPSKASRPFDVERDGFVMGEGCGILILEELESAIKRQAPILAEMVGYGATADAFHITAPDPVGAGAGLAMKRALLKARVAPEDVSYINAHGTSTQLGDVAETLAIKDIFGEAAYKVPISSTKSMLGHLLGAAGSVEAVISVKAVQEGVAPPTINLEHPDPQCDLDYIPEGARELDIKFALSNSFGFGGHNVSLLFKQFRG
ncbi:MAG TPA: beta-ketoacyl-ACP synthase II [Candidatus Dormibacteraeota bacterium]|nr:beta-ketoacyl-ACP synthase II [Candidatus Dormibacteraeota bacterium]